mgnify:FL=1
MALMERMTIRGRDRIADRVRNRRTAENHQAAGTKNDRTAVDPGAEDRERMAN